MRIDAKRFPITIRVLTTRWCQSQPIAIADDDAMPINRFRARYLTSRPVRSGAWQTNRLLRLLKSIGDGSPLVVRQNVDESQYCREAVCRWLIKYRVSIRSARSAINRTDSFGLAISFSRNLIVGRFLSWSNCWFVFIARRCDSAVCAVVVCLCLSVRPLHRSSVRHKPVGRVVSKRLDGSSWFLAQRLPPVCHRLRRL